MNSIFLKVFELVVRIDFEDRSVEPLIMACYSAFLHPRSSDGVSLMLTVRKVGEAGWTVSDGESTVHCNDIADIVYFIEKTMTIGLQRLRNDLYFVHAAAIGHDEQCTVLVGESGVGKSTLCWNLCNAGFIYLSDELAPVDPESMAVVPYPHAICLKSDSKGSHPLPRQTIRTSVTMHVPVDALPLPFARRPAKISNIIFLTHGSGEDQPVVEDISRSEAAARLYANSLNQLAHEHDGLAAAARLVSSANCFHIERSSVPNMRRAVSEIIVSSATPANQ